MTRQNIGIGLIGGGDRVLGESLVRTMIEGTPPLTGLDDGLRSAFTAFAIDQAQATGQVVDIIPDWQRGPACGPRR